MLSSLNYLVSQIILDAGHEGEHMPMDMGGMWGMFPFSPMMILFGLAGLLLIFILAYLVYKAVDNQQNQTTTVDAQVSYQAASTVTQQHLLPRYCSSCGIQVNPKDKFCSNCSAQLTSS
ncbi:MAG: zinc ribbon domain-containing protein [Candidatus Hodarchaeota archaeon]